MMRLDIACVQRGFFESRNKAQVAIKKGLISVNKALMLKPSLEVSLCDEITLKETRKFVSRAGEKLFYFFSNHFFDIEGFTALDIGSSTGGFTQVLLQQGVKAVYCVDVGSYQLHNTLKNNPKIQLFEKTDIRDFVAISPLRVYDIVVCDVSFISIFSIFKSFKDFIGRWLILLFKPQFEVGRSTKRNKKGVVIEKEVIQQSLKAMLEFLKDNGLEIRICEKSIIKGREGNEEFFIACERA
ncbi:23S rRNA (cytidine-2'-O)-methyltransferase TlyA [Helicobacter mesocricetorum]|uniref:23S rRNA (cytidine-2'-O)-methyltransferase TlyA n=1 Tax=Helicobacter mesocricetorum TaxID=87012 RepID=UPI001F48EF79|nr:TlyA family RNA methyltransferase [Helicobacter mesocricetorum]